MKNQSYLHRLKYVCFNEANELLIYYAFELYMQELLTHGLNLSG